jgi:hypothetical protein
LISDLPCRLALTRVDRARALSTIRSICDDRFVGRALRSRAHVRIRRFSRTSAVHTERSVLALGHDDRHDHRRSAHLAQFTVAPALLQDLERNWTLIGRGQMWRLLTLLVVQDGGLIGAVL